ncbi:MAG: DUF1553 domain-containing protein, partial [Acidobacteria bacterium]|nr:DUF1553 domain-containing protein [Acidobacteriota bacterium]
EPADNLVDRYDQLDDVMGTTASTFLAMTLRCARCHDHKFEPFPQKDYYRLLAVFEPLKRPQDDRKDLDRLAGTDAELSAYRQAIAVADAQVSQIQRQIDDSRKAILKRLFENKNKTGAQGDLAWLEHAETVLAFQTEPAKRNKEQKALVESFNARLDREIASAGSAEENSRFEAWKKEIAAVNAARPKEPPRAYVWYEEGPRAPATYLLQRGDPAAPGEEVRPGVPSILGPASLEPPAASRRSTGRRLWLARWMTRPDHPLVARVIVNRLWQWHFGEGLVASENDFGLMGQRPSHPELLDYLATELIRSGWSLKHIQRLIVNSGAFRLSSAWNEQAGKLDPENALLWRWKPRRLEAEVIRDAALAVGSRLNLEMGGPSIFPPLPRAVLEGQSRPGEGWGQSDEKQAARRSIYIFVKRSLAVPELEVLDTPDTSSSCEQRPVSTTGPQALAFLNGESTHQQARAFARRVERLAGLEPAAQASTAFRLALARPPKPAELKAALEFLSLQQRQIDRDSRAQGAPPARAFLEAFCLVLLNSNEFFYLN